MSLCHPSDSTLEAYACSLLGEPDAQVLEEHLLICADCREKLAHEDLLIELIRVALAEEHVHHTATGQVRIWITSKNRMWVGIVEGATVKVSRQAKSPSIAMARACDIFRRAFPDHICDHRCVIIT
jgi:hypothetical protein